MDESDDPSPSLQSCNGMCSKESENNEEGGVTAVDSNPNLSNPTAEVLASCSGPINNGAKIVNKKKKRVPKDVSAPSSSSFSSHRGLRVASTRRKPKVLIASVRRASEAEAIALPLGMSIAAVVAQVLERKDAVGKKMSVDHLSMICTLAVGESLANVFGDKFDCFVSNFEKSFRSTLRTLRSINEASQNKGRDHLSQLNIESCSSDVTSPMSLDKGGSISSSGIKDCQSEAVLSSTVTQERFSAFEEIQENMQTDSMNRELALHGQINQQLACISPSTLGSVINQSMLSTFEKSVMEQARSNDLKTFEIGLIMKELQLKETQLSLNSDMNFLERCKLSMGISRASFKAEKFKNQLVDTRHAELLRKCIDCLVAGLLIMSASLAYGAYVYSYRRITEATASCAPPKESQSWWIPKPVASISSGLHIIWCQVQVVCRMLFVVLMILAIAYLLLQRSSTPKQTMPVTFILLLLGVACGFVGKLCVETLGGSGYHWLLYWEALCLLHFFSNVCTSALFLILHGPITVSQGPKGKPMLPYWIRQVLFYATVLLFLPLLCGLIPFASPGEWKDHFSLLVRDFLPITGE